MNILVNFFCWLGRYSIRQIRAIGRLALFSYHVFRNIPGALSRFYLIAQQTHFIGNYSLSIISVSGLFVGFVLGLQGYYVLVRYGSDLALGGGGAVVCRPCRDVVDGRNRFDALG